MSWSAWSSSAARSSSVGGRRLLGLAGAVLLAALLPGCPLSDEYYVDPNAAPPPTETGGAQAAPAGAAGLAGRPGGGMNDGGTATGGGREGWMGRDGTSGSFTTGGRDGRG